MAQKISDELKEKILAEDIWLNYFNRYLLDHRVITDKEFNRMTEKIAGRKAKQLLDRVTGS